jgi:hypothetical protein
LRVSKFPPDSPVHFHFLSVEKLATASADLSPPQFFTISWIILLMFTKYVFSGQGNIPPIILQYLNIFPEVAGVNFLNHRP